MTYRQPALIALLALALTAGAASAQTVDLGTAPPPAGAFTPPAAPASPPAAAPADPATPSATPPVAAKPRVKRAPPPAPRETAVDTTGDPRPTFTPETFEATARAYEKYLAIVEAGGWPLLPKGVTLKLGSKGPNVAILRKRLAVTDDLSPDAAAGEVFDAPLAEAVKRFQARHGLKRTGIVAGATAVALQIPAETRFRQLAGSARRLAASEFPFGERYVVVNIPAAIVEAVEGGRVTRRYVAVVGKQDRPSPEVRTRITSVNFNPTWTVPTSIIKKDIIPKMQRDPSYLARASIRVLDGQGREVNPRTIDWSTERAVNFTLRQDPGVRNALGSVRIDMPNKDAVYLHDTPSKNLFGADARFHSSGCVRVADVRDLVTWLLGPQGWTRAKVDEAIGEEERRDVRLTTPVPVVWTYLTAYATADGMVHFRDDVYDLDRPPGALRADLGPTRR